MEVILSYDSTPDKIPHEVYSVLASRGCHVCLVEVGLHGIVVGELLLQGFQLGYEVFPVLMGPFGDIACEDVASELFASVGVWVHGDSDSELVALLH